MARSFLFSKKYKILLPLLQIKFGEYFGLQTLWRKTDSKIYEGFCIRFVLVRNCHQISFLMLSIHWRLYFLKKLLLRKTLYTKHQFSKFKKFVSGSAFWELQLTQVLNFKTSFCSLKIRAKVCVAFLLF